MPPELEDHDLPADLQHLAARLTREAGDLANRYPPTMQRAEASIATSGTSASAEWLRRLLGGGLAASILFAVAAISLHQWLSGGNAPTSDPESNRLVSEAASHVGQPAKSEVAQPIGKLHPVSIGLPGNSAVPLLSAPEWEAVLDLTPAEKWEGVELSL